MKKQKVPVTERAVVQRLNRVLRKEDLVLKKSRGAQTALDVGDWYVLNITENYVAEKEADVEALARKWKVLADWEELCLESK